MASDPRLAKQLEIATKRYEVQQKIRAFYALYESFSFAQDMQEAEKLRQQLHVLVDVELDTVNDANKVLRQLLLNPPTS